jgi:hypothetical protein
MKTFLHFLGSLVFASTLCVSAIVWRGYVLSLLWLWFLVPTFGLAALSIPAALGVSLVVSMLTHRTDQSPTQRDRSSSLWFLFVHAFAAVMLTPAVGLLLGLIFKGFM